MKIESKYDLGQEVWMVSTQRHEEERHSKCDLCDSTGTVEIKGNSCRCPQCYGNTYIEYGEIEYYVRYKNGKIGRISTTNYSNKYMGEYGQNNEIGYMVDCTGVGSGTVWKESQVFPTKEEALEYCNVMNGDKFKS